MSLLPVELTLEGETTSKKNRDFLIMYAAHTLHVTTRQTSLCL